ncbi:MAG TPA: Ig-like domain-containing protein, partial [Schlesneria sp.]
MLLFNWLVGLRNRLQLLTRTSPVSTRRRNQPRSSVAAMVEILEPRRVMSAVAAVDDSYQVQAQAMAAPPILLDVLVNDTSTGGAMTITSVQTPAHGTVSIQHGNSGSGSSSGSGSASSTPDQLLFTPSDGYTGTETFTYTVSDAAGDQSTATVSVTILAASGSGSGSSSSSGSGSSSSSGSGSGSGSNSASGSNSGNGSETLFGTLVATQSVPLGTTTVESFQYKSDWNWTTDATVYTLTQQQWQYGLDPNIRVYQASDGSTITANPIYSSGSSSGSGSYPTGYAYFRDSSTSNQYFSYNYNTGLYESSDGSQIQQGGSTILYRTVASATHLSDYAATIDWGDGTTSTGTFVSDSTYQLNTLLNAHVTGDHTYTTTGNYQATVTISGPGIYDNNGQHSYGNQLAGHLDVNVVPQTISASVSAVAAVKNVSFTGTVATFSDSVGNSSPGNYQATITWGDGATSTGMISSDGHGGYVVQGGHTYTYEGTLPLSVRIQKTGAAASLVTGSATVEAVSTLVATQSVPLGTTTVESFQYKSDWNWTTDATVYTLTQSQWYYGMDPYITTYQASDGST